MVEVELLVHKTFSYEKVGRWKEGGKFEWLKHMDRQTSLGVCELYIVDNAKSIWISNQLQGLASFSKFNHNKYTSS